MTDTIQAPAGAFSPHARAVARQLLRAAARRYPTGEDPLDDPLPEDRIDPIDAPHPNEAWMDQDDASTAGTPGPAGTHEAEDTPDGLDAEIPTTLFRRLAALSPSRRPIARDMDAAAISVAQAAGDDPWAVATEPGATLADRAELARLFDLARLASLLATEDDLAGLRAPGAVTLIRVPGAEVERLRGHLSNLPADLRHMPRGNATAPAAVPTGALRVIALDADREGGAVGKAAAGRARAEIERRVVAGEPLLILAPGPEALPEAARIVLARDLAWPALSADMAVEVLRVTHSETGKMSETVLRAALPETARLADLPAALLARAWAETSPIRVAHALADLCARLPRPSGPTLADLHGVPALRAELAGLARDLSDWKAGRLDWSEVASSLLLYGPPGGGKTLAAEALAGSAGAAFVATSYADCQRAGHLGDYLKAMAGRVEEAIARTPSVFFPGELDSFPVRTGGAERGDRYMASVVNGLLEQLSRLNATPGVLVVAATNHPGRVDPALIREGRFDLKLEVGHPDRTGIDAILRGHLGASLNNRPGGIDLTGIVDRLIGTSGAAVAAVARAALGAARRQGRGLEPAHLDAAADRIAPPHAPDLARAIAAHEAGHVVATLATGLARPSAVRITPSGGTTVSDLPSRRTRAHLDAVLAVLMAGRVAEEMICGAPSHGSGLGPGSDLDLATGAALALETEYGLGTGLIHAPVARDARHRLPARLRARVERHLSAAEDRARALLRDRRDLLETVAAALEAERELDGDRIAALVGDGRPDRAPDEGDAATRALGSVAGSGMWPGETRGLLDFGGSISKDGRLAGVAGGGGRPGVGRPGPDDEEKPSV